MNSQARRGGKVADVTFDLGCCMAYSTQRLKPADSSLLRSISVHPLEMADIYF